MKKKLQDKSTGKAKERQRIADKICIKSNRRRPGTYFTTSLTRRQSFFTSSLTSILCCNDLYTKKINSKKSIYTLHTLNKMILILRRSKPLFIKSLVYEICKLT